jgi:hypothetical protein
MPERRGARKKRLAEQARGTCGRATVEALRLNREGLVNLRRILYAAGEHPPAEPDEALQ